MASVSLVFNNASRSRLGLEHLEIVYKACESSASNWRRLGLKLGLHHDLLSEIAKDEKECIDCLMVMLAEWLKGNYMVTGRYPPPSHYSLCIAVNEIDKFQAVKISNDDSFTEIQLPQEHDHSKPPYTNEELQRLCGCNNSCTVEAILKVGCRKPFHHIDIDRLTREQKQVYLYHMLTKLRQIKKQYADFYSRIVSSICSNQDINVPQLRTIIKNLEWFSEAKEKNSRLQRLNECQDKESILDVYAEICSWINHHPIGEVVEKCGSENDKKEYQEYVDNTLKKFLQNSITVFTDTCSQDLGGAVPDTQHFRLKLDRDLNDEEVNGTFLPFIRGKVAELLEISLLNLHILSFRKGCFEIVFSIPMMTYKRTFPLTLTRSRALENLKYKLAGLKFKSMYYTENLSGMPDDKEIPFTSTKGQTIIHDGSIKPTYLESMEKEKELQESSEEKLSIGSNDGACGDEMKLQNEELLHSKYQQDNDDLPDIRFTNIINTETESSEALDEIIQSDYRMRGRRPQISMRTTFSKLVVSNKIN